MVDMLVTLLIATFVVFAPVVTMALLMLIVYGAGWIACIVGDLINPDLGLRVKWRHSWTAV